MRAIIFILIIFIIFSGCIGGNNVTHSNESVYQGPVNRTPENLSSTTLSSKEENIPEIEVTSFSSVCTHSKNDRAILEKIDGYLFCWDNVPGNESQRLISYLKNDLNISWVDNAQIVKTNNDKTIRVFAAENSLNLTIGNNASTILTTIDSVPSSYLQIKKENGKICIYRLEEYKPGYNVTEKYYAVYGLSITNNGSKNLYFKLNGLNVRDGNHIFNTTIAPECKYSSFIEVLSDIERETKLEDTALFPGQTVNGSVIFQVNSLYNESFILMYDGTPIHSTPFEKNIKTLRAVENYNYSTVFGIPPYKLCSLDPSRDLFEPNLESYPGIFPNWVNRSVFEFFNKADSNEMLKYPPAKIPPIDVVYALKVIPEKNITMLPSTRLSPNTLCVDDTGEELINTSISSKVIILNSQKNFSNVTVIKISYQNVYGWPMMGRFSFIDQDLILDDKLNLVVAKYYCGNFIS